MEDKKTQTELFKELNALNEVRRLSELAVENKMGEIADVLGSTFAHEGMCEAYPDAPVLQIRVRFNKPKGRKVPFFVPLEDFPSTWLSGPRKRVQNTEAVEPDTEPMMVLAPSEESLCAPLVVDADDTDDLQEFDNVDGIVVG